MIYQLQPFIYIMINLEKAQPTQRKLSDLAKKNRVRNKSSYQQLKVNNSKLYSVVQKVKPDESNLSKSLVGRTEVIDRYNNKGNHQYKRVAINNSLNFTAFNLVQTEHQAEQSRKKSPKILKRDLVKPGNKSLPLLKQQSQYTYQQSRIQFLKAALSGYQNIQEPQRSNIKSTNKNTINITSQQKNSFMTQAFPTQILTSRKQDESSQRKRPNTLRDSTKLIFSDEVKQIVKQTLYDIEIERMVKKRQEGNRSLFSFRQKEIFIQKMKKILQAQKK